MTLRERTSVSWAKRPALDGTRCKEGPGSSYVPNKDAPAAAVVDQKGDPAAGSIYARHGREARVGVGAPCLDAEPERAEHHGVLLAPAPTCGSCGWCLSPLHRLAKGSTGICTNCSVRALLFGAGDTAAVVLLVVGFGLSVAAGVIGAH